MPIKAIPAVVCASVLTVAAAAGPATPAAPATKPTAAVPKDWVRVDNKPGHFHFFVPPTWKAVQKSDAQAAFALPKVPHQPPVLFAVVGAACHASTVEQDAGEFRDTLKAGTGPTAGAKVTRDEAATLGGRPAWAFEWSQPLAAVARPAAPGRPAAPPPPRATSHVLQMMRAQGSTHFIVTFQGDATGYAASLPLATRVLETLTWDDADPGR